MTWPPGVVCTPPATSHWQGLSLLRGSERGTQRCVYSVNWILLAAYSGLRWEGGVRVLPWREA